MSGFSSNTLKLTWVPRNLLRFLQPKTVSSEMKYEYSCIKVAKVMTGHHQIPLKIKRHLFTSCFNIANDRVKFDYWGRRKTWLFFDLYGMMTWIWRLQRFFKTVTLEVLTKKVAHFDQLRHWQKIDVNRKMLVDFF